MRADYEQLPEDIGYPLNAAFNEDEDQEAEPRRTLEAARDTNHEETPTSRGATTTTWTGND